MTTSAQDKGNRPHAHTRQHNVSVHASAAVVLYTKTQIELRVTWVAWKQICLKSFLNRSWSRWKFHVANLNTRHAQLASQQAMGYRQRHPFTASSTLAWYWTFYLEDGLCWKVWVLRTPSIMTRKRAEKVSIKLERFLTSYRACLRWWRKWKLQEANKTRQDKKREGWWLHGAMNHMICHKKLQRMSKINKKKLNKWCQWEQVTSLDNTKQKERQQNKQYNAPGGSWRQRTHVQWCWCHRGQPSGPGTRNSSSPTSDWAAHGNRQTHASTPGPETMHWHGHVHFRCRSTHGPQLSFQSMQRNEKYSTIKKVKHNRTTCANS